MESRTRGNDAGGRGSEIRSIRHGDEQRLLPLRSPRIKPGIQDNAGSAADELAWQSLCGQNRFRVVGTGSSAIKGCGACMAAMRRHCGNPASARTQFKRPCDLPRSCSQLRLRSKRQGMVRHKRRSNPPFPRLRRPLFGGRGAGESLYPRADCSESVLPVQPFERWSTLSLWHARELRLNNSDVRSSPPGR